MAPESGTCVCFLWSIVLGKKNFWASLAEFNPIQQDYNTLTHNSRICRHISFLKYIFQNRYQRVTFQIKYLPEGGCNKLFMKAVKKLPFSTKRVGKKFFTYTLKSYRKTYPALGQFLLRVPRIFFVYGSVRWRTRGVSQYHGRKTVYGERLATNSAMYQLTLFPRLSRHSTGQCPAS